MIKKIVSTLLAALLIGGMAGCQGTTNNKADVYLADWLVKANLAAEETPEQLYQAALKEDTLVIYSQSTRIYDVKKSFEAQYPGLTVEVSDMRAGDMIQTLKASYDKQEWLCDVVICADDSAVLSSQLLPLHIVNKYVPHDIRPFLRETANQEVLDFVGETEQLFYNSAVYKESPVNNWWELTEPQWQGKVYMNSPTRSLPAYAFVHGVLANGDKMAEAYQQLYGKPLDLPAGSSAGEVFFEQLVANGMRFTSSSTELVELVGAPNQKDPPVAFMISSKIREVSIGMPLAVAYGAAPCDGIYSSNSVSIAGGAKNVNAAKLFVRCLLGETDATGEGLKPYNLEGTWPVRTDVECQSKVPLAEGNFWFNDKQQVADMDADLLAFWEELQKQVETKE